MKANTAPAQEAMTELQAAQVQRAIWLQFGQDCRTKLQQCMNDIDMMGEVANARVAQIQSRMVVAEVKKAEQAPKGKPVKA